MLTLNVFTSSIEKFLEIFDYGLTGVCLFIDSVVYWVIAKLFDSFTYLASAELIQADVYQEMADRIEVVIGVVMLFFVASALLKAIVDPDSINKGAAKIAKNCIISIVLLGIVPVIFNYAFKLQNLIISEHIIEKLLFGNEGDTPEVNRIGYETALNVLEVFLVIPESTESKGGVPWGGENGVREMISKNGTFPDIVIFIEQIKDEENGVSYMPLIASACGIFLIYVLLSFCIDLGIRVIKLAFYQIIAPIPILMYIIPEKKSVFDNWVKATIATYMEVFIRLFVMFGVVFLVQAIF